MRNSRLAWLAGLLLACMAVARAADGPSVIELFTSEGCSSCPPAEALLGELARRPDVIALACHVDYWDGLGWRDRFAMPLCTLRQRRYVGTLRQSSAYTPQAVIDGRYDVVGSDASGIGRRLAAPRALVWVGITPATARIRLRLPALPRREAVDLLLLDVLPQATTTVGGGENSGRTIHEYNIVRSLRFIGRWDGSEATRDVPLDDRAAPAAAWAVLAQRVSDGVIVAAGWLREGSAEQR
jgi:hypothetical protein